MGRVPGIVKWLLAPAAAALLGYSVIGPRMAGKIPKSVSERVGKLVPLSRSESEANSESKPSEETTVPPSTSPPPAVTVDAQPENTAAPAAKEDGEKPKPRRRRKRRRRHSTPRAEAPAEAAPAPERAGPDPASTP